MTTLEKVRRRAESEAKSHGYYLNPDRDFLKSLLEGIKQNEDRYGYPSCPCRLASGKFEFDKDIICPCDYREPDLEEYGHCYCALYVGKGVFEGKTTIASIPERRPLEKQTKTFTVSSEAIAEKQPEATTMATERPSGTKMKMWYCKQCGYVCFREEPPLVCPICKAKREMFARIAISTNIHG